MKSKIDAGNKMNILELVYNCNNRFKKQETKQLRQATQLFDAALNWQTFSLHPVSYNSSTVQLNFAGRLRELKN